MDKVVVLTETVSDHRTPSLPKQQARFYFEAPPLIFVVAPIQVGMASGLPQNAPSNLEGLNVVPFGEIHLAVYGIRSLAW